MQLLVLFLAILVGNNLAAYDGPIKIRRACLDPNDSTITLYFNQLNNNCGTFNQLEVMGRLVKTMPDNYVPVDTIQILPSGETLSFKQPDLKQWEYFIKYYFMCDGVTVLYSDTVRIDVNPPDFIELDSVSVDGLSQKIQIGWPANTSIDHKGYLIFENVSSNNVQVADQNTNGYVHLGSKPGLGPATYTYNSYDSCNNFNILAKPHTSIYLKQNYSFCDLSITLTWTPYVGWNTDKYYIYAAINGGSFILIDSTSTLTYVLQNAQKGADYCLFVRSKKVGSSYTSSSNRVCFTFPNYPVVQNTHIKSISVRNTTTIEIKWYTEQSDVSVDASLYRGESPQNMQFIKSINYSNGDNYVTDLVDTDKSSYFYQIIVEDSCIKNHDTSLLTQSVFLSKNDNTSTIDWTSFIFDQSINTGDLVYFNGSTWNLQSTIVPGLNNSFAISLDSAQCFRIISVSARGDSSISNIVCVEDELRVFIPTAIKFNGNGANAVFGIYGTGIDWENTTVGIFTRWGEKIFEIGENQKTWDGTYKQKRVQSGIYLYTGLVIGLKNEKKLVKGTVLILD